MEKEGSIRAISRGIAVIQAVNRGGALSMMEIAQTSEVPYPTACRIVSTLVGEGLIEREPNRKRYRPTALVQTLSHGFQGQGALVEAARPHIAELTRMSGWPITLTTHVGASMVIRDSTHSLTSLTFNNYFPGYAIPILECAAGLAYIAHIGDAERESILHSLAIAAQPSQAHMLTLVSDPETLERLRKGGFAIRGNNQFTQNPGKTSSIAVPVIRNGRVEGALTLAFFSRALRMEEAQAQFVAPLMACATQIAADLGRSR